MAMIHGFLQPSEADGITFSLNAVTASAVKTLYPNAIFQITSDQAIAITFGSSGGSVPLSGTAGKTPATPSATVGFMLPANTTPTVFWLGPNRDSFKVFNLSGTTAANISFVPLMP